MIDIVIATYNPKQRHIKELLMSIYEQSYIDKVDRIIISDDGSEADIIEYIKSLVKVYPNVDFHPNPTGLNGPKNNFQHAVELSTARFVMFCDQDDIWLSNKVETLYKAIEMEENKEKLPLLVSSDAYIVDDELDIISESFFDYTKFKEENFSTVSLLTRNVAPGCTMIVNRRLCELAIPIPKVALMHDWWFLLVALKFGKVKFLKERTILYRQHDNNCVGVNKGNVYSRILFSKTSLFINYFNYFKQVLLQLEKIIGMNSAYKSDTFDDIVRNISLKTKFSRIVFVLKYMNISIKKKMFLILILLFSCK